MRLRFRGPRLRVSLRGLALLVAVAAVVSWAGLEFTSPTRRFGRLLAADQPAYVRREAASSLGRDVPFWEVDRALGLLVGALDDPSPRVRESALAGLWWLGPRGREAVPKIVARLNDPDRWVRFAAARALGRVLGPRPADADEALAAVARALDDADPGVRLAAAETLVETGREAEAAETLAGALTGPEPAQRSQAVLIIRKVRDRRPYLDSLALALRDPDHIVRDFAYHVLDTIAPADFVKSALDASVVEGDPETRRWAEERRDRLTPPR